METLAIFNLIVTLAVICVLIFQKRIADKLADDLNVGQTWLVQRDGKTMIVRDLLDTDTDEVRIIDGKVDHKYECATRAAETARWATNQAKKKYVYVQADSVSATWWNSDMLFDVNEKPFICKPNCYFYIFDRLAFKRLTVCADKHTGTYYIPTFSDLCKVAVSHGFTNDVYYKIDGNI